MVCSNSLKSETENTAPWLLKEELRRMGSALLDAAMVARVPGGQALTVDRHVFASEVTRRVEGERRIRLVREEVQRIPGEGITIVASGPLTSGALAEIGRVPGSGRLFFYDSISPIVEAETIDMGVAFRASRYGKSIDGSDDYVTVRSTVGDASGSWTRFSRPKAYRIIFPKIIRSFSKLVCRLKSWRGAGDAAVR